MKLWDKETIMMNVRGLILLVNMILIVIGARIDNDLVRGITIGVNITIMIESLVGMIASKHNCKELEKEIDRELKELLRNED